MANEDPSIPERGAGQRRLIIAGAGLLTLAATAVFLLSPPEPVLIGWQPGELLVPWYYQVSVFPAFGLFAGALVSDRLTRRARASWLSRALLLGSTSAMATLRLLAWLPVSGHAVFLCAMLTHQLGAPKAARAPLGLPLVLAGLAITLIHKVLWRDIWWCLFSVVVGILLGAVALGLGRLRPCSRNK